MSEPEQRTSKERWTLEAEGREYAAYLKSSGVHGYTIVQDLVARIEHLQQRVAELEGTSVRVTAWYRGVQISGGPSEPTEYDVEMSYGDDQPEGKGWIPLYRRPPQPPNVTRLQPPNSKLARISDISDELIREMRRQGIETLQACLDGMRVRIDPWPAETNSPPTSAQCDLLDFLAQEYLHLIPFDRPTGAGDADVGWRVLQSHIGKGDIEIAAVYEDDPRKAIEAARAALTKESSQVGCEGNDGLLRVHSEAETCDVCQTDYCDRCGASMQHKPDCQESEQAAKRAKSEREVFEIVHRGGLSHETSPARIERPDDCRCTSGALQPEDTCPHHGHL